MMALPKLETPKYETTLPSTGKKVQYRPFLVREYKILLTSLEAESDQIAKVIEDLVDVCTFNKLDMNRIAHFDIEYLFLQIRSKSISEVAELTISCDCGAKIPHNLNLEDIKVEKIKEHNRKIFLNETVGVEMRYPRFDEIVDIVENMSSERVVDLARRCILGVFTENDYVDASSTPREELDEFINSLTKKQFDKIENFFLTMPKVVQEIDVKCPECSSMNNVRLEGIQNFFV